MLLLSGVQILLSKYSGQEDIIVGTPVSGRDHAGLADQIGFYVNTLAIRGYIDGNQSFEEYIQVLKDRLLAAYDHQGYPFDKLVEELGVSGDGSRSPLFDVMVVMEHAASTESLFEKNKLEVFPGESVTTTSKFDLTFHFTESSAEISLGIEYNTSLYKCSRIERMVGHLVNILNAIANNAKQRIGDMVYLSAAEEQELRSFSGEVSVVSEALSVPALLYEMVQQHGDAIALSDGITNYTYDEFWNKSGRIAGYLQQQCKVKPEALVGIVMDKGPDFILAMAGILRSGAAYLPIESHLPEDRIRLLLKVGGVAAVLTNNTAIAEMVSDGYMPCVDIQVAMREGAQVSQVAISKSSLAYVMFTSGSTGEPKGVMIEHRGIVRLVRDTNYVRLNNKDKILQGGSLTFDVATFEIWGALLNGGTLYITALEHLLDTTRLRLFIQQYGITRMWFTSSWFNQLADEDPSLFSSLQQILVGGEQLSVVHVGKVMASCPHLVVTNGYGPTEDTTFAVCGDVRKEDILSGIIRLGKPISKSRTYIVDKHGNLAGKGVYGELLLGGEGISRGYLNDALRTAAAFVANPFVPGERVYRSGDIGCWDEDGRIIFRGRRDNQVKIRGYRVEPLEIARVLEKHEAVREAAVKVVVGAGGDKQLAAYYTGEANAVATIRLYLEKHLPSYMRPTYLQWLPVFALNASGKTDMKALPAPVMEETSYTAAATEWEVYLVNVWSEVLHISAAGLSVEANFFELGGQSLKAIALIGRIHRDRGVKIPLVELFTHATIRGLAGYLSVQSQVVYTGLVVAPVNAYYPVSYAQRRMYLLQQFDTFSTAYNIPLQLPLPDGYSIEEVSVALQKLVNRHEVLRTSFEEREGVPVQVVHASVTLELNAYDGVEADGFVMPFDLSVAPLLRAGYYNSGNRIVLLLDIHHIITDGLSQAILQDEFIRLLSGEVLAPVPFQYKDYAVYEQSAAGQLQLAGHSEYWASRLSGELPVLELPVDFARSEVRSLQGASTEVRLNTDEVLFLRGLCSEEGVTLYMAGLSLWSLLLWRVSGQEDIITGTPVSGRQHADLAGIAGLFVNTLAIRNKITESQRYKEFLKTVKNNVLSDFEHEGYPFELLLEAVWPYRDRSRHPLFDTMFSVQNKNAFWQEMGEDDEVSAEISEAFFTDRGGKFDLNLRLVEYGEDVYLHLGYNTTLFTAETAHALLDGYRELMASLQADKLQYLFDLQLLSTASRLLLSTAALLDSVVPANTYSNVFEARAAKSGDAIAVKDENGFLSYADLNYKANQLAHYLHNNGIATGSVVGVLLPPCKEMMVGIIGIFKAGCAYLPIDISQPAARIEHILSDSDVDCVVTVGELPEGLEYSGMIVDLLSP
ncbi:gramicidin S synthase 2/tyrocidine synthetase-3, partial [Filimonas lacunae]